MKRWIACFLTLLLCIAALPVSAAEASAPSPWAEAEINEAISAGLVPEELQTDYQQDITREEFAHLAVQLCMVKLRYVGGPEQFVEDYRLYFHDREGNPAAAISRIFPFRFAPVTEITCFRAAKGAGFFSEAHPHTSTFAAGLNFKALEIACRLLCSASAVTAQVLMMYKSALSSSLDTV